MTEAHWEHLQAAGLLSIGAGCRISPWAILEPADLQGDVRPIELADGVRVGHGAILYGGVRLGAAAVVEEHAVVGKPEYGYAIGRSYPGAGAATEVGAEVIIRGGAVVYAGACIRDRTPLPLACEIRSSLLASSPSIPTRTMSLASGSPWWYST